MFYKVLTPFQPFAGKQNVLINLKHGFSLWSGLNMLTLHNSRLLSSKSYTLYGCKHFEKENVNAAHLRSFSTLYKLSGSKLVCSISRPVNSFTNLSTINIGKLNNSKKEALDQVKSMNYESLYLIDYIKIFRLLGIMAQTSAVVTILGLSSSCLYYFNLMSMDTVISITMTCLVSLVIFLGPSMIISRVIAKVMISENSELLKISYCSIFGKRRDIYVKPKNLIVDRNPGRIKSLLKVKTIEFQNSNKKLYFLPTASSYSEFETLNQLFSIRKKEDKSQH